MGVSDAFWETYCKDCPHEFWNEDDRVEDCDLVNPDDCPHRWRGTAEADKLPDGAFSLTVNADALTDYISAAFSNAGAEMAERVVREKVGEIIKETCHKKLEALTEAAMKAKVDEMVSEYFSTEVFSTEDRWGNAGKITRLELLKREVEGALTKVHGDYNYQRILRDVANAPIERFMNKLRGEVKREIENTFSEAALGALTQSVVNVLTSTETYQRMQTSVNALLPEPEKKT